MAQLLKFHLLDGRLTVTDLTNLLTQGNGSAAVITQGGALKFALVQGQGVVINDAARPTVYDIQTGNGVIHVINGVLIPAN